MATNATKPLPSETGLIPIDLINHFEFERGDRPLRETLAIVSALHRMLERARRSDVPVIDSNADLH
jgi:hypothetical protein